MSPDCADCIMFNFGYLPGGLMSLCIYSGGDTGFEEKDALLSFVINLDPKKYLVILSEYANRAGNPPISVFIFKEVR